MEQEEKNSITEGTESLRPALEASRQWIEARYGPISLGRHSVMFGPENAALVTVVVAAVPVYKGVAIGVGATEGIAINALRGELSGETQRAINAASSL